MSTQAYFKGTNYFSVLFDFIFINFFAVGRGDQLASKEIKILTKENPSCRLEPASDFPVLIVTCMENKGSIHLDVS